MAISNQLTVVELDRDRFTRQSEITVSNLGVTKIIKTPHFCFRVKSEEELDLLVNLKSQFPLEHSGTIIIRFFDTPNSIIPKIAKSSQTNIFGGMKDYNFVAFLKGNIVLIDPSLEYLYYEAHLNDFLGNPRTPYSIKKYVQELVTRKKFYDNRGKQGKQEYAKFKESNHINFWDGLYEEEGHGNLIKMIREILKHENDCKADILLPPTPLITNLKTLKISFTINDLSRGYSKNVLGKECATYFMLHENVLRDTRILDEIKKYLVEIKNPSLLAVFKFKNLNLTESGKIAQRENYRDFMLELDFLKKNFENRFTMVLENGNQCYPSVCVGFDIVSTTLANFDGDGGKYQPFGAYYDSKAMVNRPFEDIEKMYNNNGRKFPCGCSVCTTHTLESAKERWKNFRKEHHILKRNEEMLEIKRAIRERNIELARMKLNNSEISNLRHLIPTS